MSFQEDEYRMISELQHFVFCRRQWALIHLEQAWADNARTVAGQNMHHRAHDESITEKRGNTIIVRGMRVSSPHLGISGICDVVEFHRGQEGVQLIGEEGLWNPYPVEYKRGNEKIGDEDRIQLCAQALCLEEMFCCSIPEGALYYGESRRREKVAINLELRKEVSDMLVEIHEYVKRGYTPKVKRKKHCNACSLKDLCLPMISSTAPVAEYIDRIIREDIV